MDTIYYFHIFCTPDVKKYINSDYTKLKNFKIKSFNISNKNEYAIEVDNENFTDLHKFLNKKGMVIMIYVCQKHIQSLLESENKKLLFYVFKTNLIQKEYRFRSAIKIAFRFCDLETILYFASMQQFGELNYCDFDILIKRGDVQIVKSVLLYSNYCEKYLRGSITTAAESGAIKMLYFFEENGIDLEICKEEIANIAMCENFYDIFEYVCTKYDVEKNMLVKKSIEKCLEKSYIEILQVILSTFNWSQRWIDSVFKSCWKYDSEITALFVGVGANTEK